MDRTDYGGREGDVVRVLEEDIIFGRLKPGTRLVEDWLLERFEVSRHGVRQALQRLERLGVVTRERNKGATVRRLAPAEVEQIYEVRELLQRQAALMIRLPASPALLDALEEIHRIHGGHVDAAHLRGVHEANDLFHVTIFAACGNDYLVSSIKHYMRLSLPVRANSLADIEKLKVSRQHHAFMIDAMRRTDNWVLAQLCVDHLQPSKSSYLKELANADPPAGQDDGSASSVR